MDATVRWSECARLSAVSEPSSASDSSSSRAPLLLVAVAVLGLVGALFWANSRSSSNDGSADGSGGTDQTESDGGEEATGDAGNDSEGGDDDESSVTAEPAVDLPNDPIDDPLVYSCAGRRFTIDELARAVGSDGSSSAELEGAGFDLDVIGDSAGWALTESGVAIATTPLPTEPPALAIAEPGADPLPCVAIRAGGFDLRSVAWERVDGDIVIESCVSADEVVLDTRQVDGQDVLSVFAPFEDATAAGLGTSCRLAGDVIVDADTDTDLSSLTFPLVTSNARTWQLLGFGVDVAPLEANSLGVVECAVTPDTTEVFVGWSSIAPGFDVTVLADGADLFTAERTAFADSAVLADAFAEQMSAVGATLSGAETTQFSNGFSDFTAPLDGTRTYEIRIEGSGIEPVVVGCGAAGLVPGGPSTTTNQDAPSPVSGDLEAAQQLFQSRAVSPYGYLRAVPICASCSSAASELVLQPATGSSSVALDFSPALSDQAGADLARVMVNPFLLHDTLMAAIAAGSDVSYTLDPTSGVPIEWTIDGEGARIECFEVDTAPPDLRASDSCSTDLDLIGS